jgi:hypothetical protein
VSSSYAGNVNDSGCGLTGSKKYPGLYSAETTSPTPSQYFAFQYWTGIDCSGFLQRIATAGKNLQIPGLSCGIPDLTDTDKHYNHTDDGAIGAWQFTDNDIVALYTDTSTVSLMKRGDILTYISSSGTSTQAAVSHATMVYCTQGDSTGLCNDLQAGEYRILHASGLQDICWNYRGRRRCTLDFDRKVVMTSIYQNSQMTGNIDAPIGLGRIKIWD